MADFEGTIERLRRRAKRSRMIFFGIGGTLLYMIGAAFYLTVSTVGSADVTYDFINPVNAFEHRIELILNEQRDLHKSGNSTDPRYSALEKQLVVATEQYGKYLGVIKNGPESDYQPGFLSSNTISQGLISLGSVVFGVLMIQIIVMFMRYYARLAELYEAQADALDASSGDPELAHKFMEQFSPNAIEIGKSPGTLYEKALETIQDVAKSKGSK